MPSTSQARPEQTATPVQPAVSGDHPGINELFALLAYGEVAAFYRFTGERISEVKVYREGSADPGR